MPKRGCTPTNSAADRIASLYAKIAEKKAQIEAEPAPDTQELIALIREQLGDSLTYRDPTKPIVTQLAGIETRKRALFVKTEVARMSLEGLTVSQISKTLGISYGYVVQLRSKLGVNKQLKRSPLAEIERLNRAGLTDGKIAAALGLTRGYICRLRNQNGIPAVKRCRK